MRVIKAAGTGAHYTDPPLAAHCSATMKLKTADMWILTVVISLFVEVRTAHKMKIHWGPQSMMYLKGKHGRRFVSEQDGRIMSLQDWNMLLKGVQPVEFSKPRQFVSAEKVLIQYLLER
ncbi:unnamed protein product [Knipowitschia caucasica]|uniref:Uncharacterized protein n=1 Tax=Knipowitschia caucasica TaxID=637954 RepID=A0AAV2L644_KNICA